MKVFEIVWSAAFILALWCGYLWMDINGHHGWEKEAIFLFAAAMSSLWVVEVARIIVKGKK
jgi:hypothetical protein